VSTSKILRTKTATSTFDGLSAMVERH